MARTFTVILERGMDGYYIASVPELQGCHTQGRTLDELMENVKEAISLCLEVQGEEVVEEPAVEFVGVWQVTV